MEDAGAAAIAVHGRTAAQSYSGSSDWDLIDRVAAEHRRSRCSAAATASNRRPGAEARCSRGGASPACWSAAARCAIRGFSSRPRRLARGERPREITMEERGAVPARLHRSAAVRTERARPKASATSPRPCPMPPARQAEPRAARGHDRWVINKLRALNSWYTKGLDNGSHLRIKVNAAESVPQLREIIAEFFELTHSAYSAVHRAAAASQRAGVTELVVVGERCRRRVVEEVRRARHGAGRLEIALRERPRRPPPRSARTRNPAASTARSRAARA